MRILRYLSLLLIACGILAIPAPAQIAVGMSVHIGPPALPVYEQPICPAAGYIWTPGYWAYGDDGYYWVPGTWVMAPQPGFLWTPVIGAGPAVSMFGAEAIGVPTSVSTAALTTASATAV